MVMHKLAYAALIAISVAAPLSPSFADTAASPAVMTNATTEGLTQQAIMNNGDTVTTKATTPYTMKRDHLDIDDINGRERGW